MTGQKVYHVCSYICYVPSFVVKKDAIPCLHSYMKYCLHDSSTKVFLVAM